MKKDIRSELNDAIFDGDFNEAQKLIEELLKHKIAKAAKLERGDIIKVFDEINPNWWLHDQGYEGDEAFTTADLQDVMESYVDDLKAKILNSGQNN